MSLFLADLRGFTFFTVCLRLLLAAAAGGIIGYGRARRKRPAGLRTYMLTTIGAALSTLLALYEYEMICGAWAPVVEEVGMKFDGSRYSSSVVSGIGFLAAGTIIASAHRQVSGLTTATGIFASVCMGIACGAGFYECVIVAAVLITIVLNVMTPLESAYKRRLHNIDIFVEFHQLEDLSTITDLAVAKHAQVFDLDIEQARQEGDTYPSAVITLKLSPGHASHSDMLSSIAELSCVRSVQELIS